MGKLLRVRFEENLLIRSGHIQSSMLAICLSDRPRGSAIYKGREAKKSVTRRIYLHVKAQGFSKFWTTQRRSLPPKAPLMTPQSLVPAVGFIFRLVTDDARATSTILTFYTL